MYLPSWYRWISSCLSGSSTEKMQASLPLFMYLQMYLITFTVWHISTLIWQLKTLSRIGQKGTTHSLVIVISSPLFSTVKDCPPSSGERLLYAGYPSVSDMVWLRNFFGNPLVHFPFSMHGLFGFNFPQGPWIMFAVTISNSSGSFSLSGISAEISESISSRRGVSFNQMRRCRCGRPL